MSTTITLTDELLVQALAKRSAHAPSPGLLGRIVEAAAAIPQAVPPARPPGMPRLGELPRTWFRLRALAGVVGAALVVAMLAGIIRPPLEPAASPTPQATASPSPGPTPETVLLGDATAQRLRLGSGVGPLDVAGAFGSVWVADILANQVRRYEGDTMAETGRVAVQGPAWFAVADNALWVTNQLGLGASRIDPASLTQVARVADVAPCGRPISAFDSLWFSACDAQVYIRIDPVTNTITDNIPAEGHLFLELIGDQLVVVGPDGLATLDPITRQFTPVPGTPGAGGTLIGADDDAAWVRVDGEVRRIDPADGRTIASFPYPDAAALTAADGHAWLAVNLVGVVDIDLATNTVVQTIPVRNASGIARAFGGVLWFTDFDNNALWRIEP